MVFFLNVLVFRFVKDLEDEDGMEEENIPDEIKQSGVNPLYYIAPTNRDDKEDAPEDLVSNEISVNASKCTINDNGENSTAEDMNINDVALEDNSLDKNVDDTVDILENIELKNSDCVAKSPEISLSLVYTEEDLEADTKAKQTRHPEKIVEKEEEKKLSQEEKANQYEMMRNEIDEMKAKYEALFNMLSYDWCLVLHKKLY